MIWNFGILIKNKITILHFLHTMLHLRIFFIWEWRLMLWDAKVEFSLQFNFEAGFLRFSTWAPFGFPSPTGVAYDPTIEVAGNCVYGRWRKYLQRLLLYNKKLSSWGRLGFHCRSFHVNVLWATLTTGISN